jgi:hypothetical protein
MIKKKKNYYKVYLLFELGRKEAWCELKKFLPIK